MSGSSTVQRTFAEVLAAAEARGLDLGVHVPAPNELVCDIDTAEQLVTLNRGFKLLCEHFGDDLNFRITPSPSGLPNKFHARVTLPRPVRNMAERLLLQACLGSDPMRELLSWRRLENGCEERAISVTFEKPWWDE